MILKMLLDLLYAVMSVLLVIKIPGLPDGVMSYIDTAFQYISAGAGILANYVPLDYFMILFGVILAVDGGIVLYHFVMWIIRKIPMAGIS